MQQGHNHYPVRYEAEDAYTVDLYRSAMNTVGPPVCVDNHQATGGTIERRSRVDRREGTWRAFLYGNFRPRRRSSRRAADDHLFLIDWYEPHLLYLALGVMLLSCMDALFTLNLLPLGATEANWAMASMLEQGMGGFLASKFGLTAVSLVLLVAVVRRKFYRSISVEHVLKFFFTGYLLLICYEIYLFKYVFKFNFF